MHNVSPITGAKRTPLYACHKDCQAVFVDFAGWEMPVRYGSQQQEHLAVRQHAGMFDVSHMLAVDVRGKDARQLARLVLSNDTDRIIRPGGALYGCMLNPEGGTVDDTIWWLFDETHLLVVLNAGCRDKDLAWLKEHARGMQVDITPKLDCGIVAVQGPKARELLAGVRPNYACAGLSPMQAEQVGDVLVSRTGYTGEDGVELIVPNNQLPDLWRDLLAAGVTPCGLGARDTLRLEAGMCLYGHELSDSISPLEAGIGWCVDWSDPERKFIGKQALHARPKAQLRQQVALVLSSGGVLRQGHRVMDAEGALQGELTSGGYSPCMQNSIGLALLAPGATGPFRVEVRARQLDVHQVTVPFVRKGKVLIKLP